MNLKLLKGFLLILVCTGCATYQGKMRESRNLLKQGQFTEALAKLQVLAETPSDDQLVYLLDYGTALHMAGQYKESNQVFLKADKLTEAQDYHSVTNVIGATLGGEEMIQYKGESYEKFLINAYLALNFLMLGEYDDALIEAKRINEKLSKMKMDGREPYELSPFARYLAALIWEAQKKYDDAYIEFEGAYKLDQSIPRIEEDLIRSAKNARREQTYAKWKKEFPKVEEAKEWYDKKLGSLVVIFEQGWGPEKYPVEGNYTFPKLYPVISETQAVQLFIDDKPISQTVPVYNVTDNAIYILEKDYGALIARRMAALAAKAVAADQIRQKHGAWGDVAYLAMRLADRADLRQWSTLPNTFQTTRVYLKPGKYKVRLQGLGYNSSITADTKDFGEIEVKAGKLSFLNYRALR